jgi:hypothetical protein
MKSEKKARLKILAQCEQKPAHTGLQRIRESLPRTPDGFNHFTNHRNVNWADHHTQYDKHDVYSVR